MAIDNSSSFCSLLANDEPMVGTAAHHRVWILLEYAGIWTNKAIFDNSLPPEVNAYLQQQLAMIPQAEALFIKQRQRANTATVRLFVADLRSKPVVYGFELGGYDELMGVEIAGILNGAEDGSAHLHHDPLYLVCTNGKRDLCCAKFGLPVYQTFSDQVGEQAWETTHIGGHRYAPTLISFPDGICYGRVAPSDVNDIIQAEKDGQLLPHLLRGQAALPPEVQAATHFLREQTGDLALTAWAWQGTEVMGELTYRITLKRQSNNEVHVVTVQRENIPAPTPVGCNGKVKPVPRFSLLS
jgi:hypothetical protein